MIPQGTGVVNTSYYAGLTGRVNNAGSCSELQLIATEILNSLNAELAAIDAQMANLLPIAALLSAPSSPSDVVTWVTNFITSVLKPMYAPYVNYEAQLAALTASIAALLAAIESKASSFESCSISTPTML